AVPAGNVISTAPGSMGAPLAFSNSRTWSGGTAVKSFLVSSPKKAVEKNDSRMNRSSPSSSRLSAARCSGGTVCTLAHALKPSKKMPRMVFFLALLDGQRKLPLAIVTAPAIGAHRPAPLGIRHQEKAAFGLLGEL